MTKKIVLLQLINLMVSIVIIGFLLLISIFWIGTEEQHNEIVANNSIIFIITKLVISLIFIFFSLIFVWFLNVIFKKILNIKDFNYAKILKFEAFLFLVAAVLFTLWSTFLI